MLRHNLKILQHLLQDFKSVYDHFMTLRSKGLILSLHKTVVFICAEYFGLAPFTIHYQ